MGNHAKVALIFAQTDPELGTAGSPASSSTPTSPASPPQEIHHKIGPARLGHRRAALDEVEVPDEAMLGEVGDGFKVAMSALDSGRYSRRVRLRRHDARAASTRRSTTRRSASSSAGRSPRFQLVQAMIADMVVDMEAARGLAWRAGVLKDQGKPNTTETSIAKLFATEAAVRCANTAIQVHGGSGYVDDHPVERYFRDVRVTTLYEGTSQIQKLIIGRAATGINALT